MRKLAYLIEPPKFDISELYEDYEVRMIFEARTARSFRELLPELYQAMHWWAKHNFDPSRDVFVLTGNQSMLAIATMAIGDAHPGTSIKLLRYSTSEPGYVLCEISRGNDGRNQGTSVGSVLSGEGVSQPGVPTPLSHQA